VLYSSLLLLCCVCVHVEFILFLADSGNHCSAYAIGMCVCARLSVYNVGVLWLNALSCFFGMRVTCKD